MVTLCVCLITQSYPTLCDPMDTAHLAPLSMGFSRQEYLSGLPCPPPGDLPNPGIQPRSPASQMDSLLYELPGKPEYGDYRHEVKWCLFLGKGAMTMRQHIKKQRHHFANKDPYSLCTMTMVFPVVMYRCESCTIKKAEHQRIEAFELWCWRRLLRVPWTARLSNQSILKGNQCQIFIGMYAKCWSSITLAT